MAFFTVERYDHSQANSAENPGGSTRVGSIEADDSSQALTMLKQAGLPTNRNEHATRLVYSVVWNTAKAFVKGDAEGFSTPDAAGLPLLDAESLANLPK